MKNETLTTIDAKNSNIESSFAHETRKINLSRSWFLTCFYVAALVVAAAFTSCSDDDDHVDKNGNENGNGDEIETESEIETFSLDGVQIQGLTTAVRAVKLEAWWEITENSNEWEVEFIATGTVAGGRINIKFPESIDEKFLTKPTGNESHDEELFVSNSSARIASVFDLFGYNAEDEEIGGFGYYNASTEWFGRLWYADRDVTIEGVTEVVWGHDYYDAVYDPYGELIRPEEIHEIIVFATYYLNLKRGWNMVYIKEDETNETVMFTSTPPSDGALSWHFNTWWW